MIPACCACLGRTSNQPSKEVGFASSNELLISIHNLERNTLCCRCLVYVWYYSNLCCNSAIFREKPVENSMFTRLTSVVWTPSLQQTHDYNWFLGLNDAFDLISRITLLSEYIWLCLFDFCLCRSSSEFEKDSISWFDSVLTHNGCSCKRSSVTSQILTVISNRVWFTYN